MAANADARSNATRNHTRTPKPARLVEPGHLDRIYGSVLQQVKQQHQHELASFEDDARQYLQSVQVSDTARGVPGACGRFMARGAPVPSPGVVGAPVGPT